MRAAIVMPNWVGDVAMATPALRTLRDHWREAHLIGVMQPRMREVLSGTEWIDECICWDRRSTDPKLSFRCVVKELRHRRIHAAVLLSNSLRAGLLAWLSGAELRIGYARYGRGPLLTHALRPPRKKGRLVPVSAVDYYLKLAEAAGGRPQSSHLQLATLPADEAAAERIWQNLGLGSQVVGLHCGGAWGAAKSWPADLAAELARRVFDENGMEVLVVCGPGEEAEAAEIEHRADRRGVRSLAAHPTGIGELKAVIRRMRLLISTDSGPRHLAAGLGVPTVSLAGPIDPRWSDNRNPRSLVLTADLECRPCGKRTCPLKHHRCMRDLSADRVLNAARKVLAMQGCP